MNVFVATVIRAILIGISVLTGDKAWEDEELIQVTIAAAVGVGALAWGLLEKKRLIQRGNNPSSKVRLRRKKTSKDPATDAIVGLDRRTK